MNREFSAGGLVFQKKDDQVLWLIRRPTGNAGYRGNLGWSFPKGWLDDINEGKDPGPISSGQVKAGPDQLQQAALREVAEEGGVEAKIITKLPTLKIFFTNSQKEKVMKFITYFVMEYVKDVPGGYGWETAETKWVTPSEAQQLLTLKNDRQLLTQAAAMIE
ncbi:MAG: NUDIX domain-containing protein [bacterium]|nr:NUDIX domain-containing protein [bacterium]